jgi:hypothetical protein
MFACHIAGFQDMGGGLTSAKFALPIPTVIELSKFKAIPANRKVILVWVTENEIDNTGFNILRAEAENGPYKKISGDDLIPARGSSVEGAGYCFIDNTVNNRITYYYKLEDIDTNGIATQNGPVNATPRFIYGKGRLK